MDKIIANIKTTKTSLDDLENAFVTTDIFFSPAELYGFLISHICLKKNLTLLEWLDAAQHLLDIKIPLGIMHTTLASLFHISTQQLKADDYSFTISIDEDLDIKTKITYLAQWCRGYVVGFTNCGKKNNLSVSKDIQQIILDLSKISQISTDNKEDSDEVQEKYYSEIIEYVRLGVINIFDEYVLRPTTAPSK